MKEITEQEKTIGRLRKSTAVPDVADLFQQAMLESLAEEGIKHNLQIKGLEVTPENIEMEHALICAELEAGKPSSYGMEKAKKQHKALQRIRHSEKSLMIARRDGSEDILQEAEEDAGASYKANGIWKVRGAVSTKHGVIINDAAVESPDYVNEATPEDKALQQSALSDLSEQDRIWLWEYESRGKGKGLSRTAKDRQRASRLRKKVRKANKGLTEVVSRSGT